MTVALAPAYQDLTFMAPLSELRAGQLVSFLASGLDSEGVVLDIGCGWSELLLRVLEAVPSCRGVGVDLDGESIEHGRSVAEERGLAARVSLIEGDGKHAAPEHPMRSSASVRARCGIRGQRTLNRWGIEGHWRR